MTSKIKNDASRYLTRATLGGAPMDRKAVTPLAEVARGHTEAAKRESQGVLDQRWYIQLPPKR